MEIPDLQNSKWIGSHSLWVYYGIIFLVGGLLLFFWRATPFDLKNLASIFPWGKIQSQEGSQSQWDSVKNYSPSEKESFLWSWMYRVTNSIKGYTLASIWDFPLLYPRAIAIDAYDNIYIGESYQWSGTHARILKFSSTGELLGWWGKWDITSGWHPSSSGDIPVGNGDAPWEFNYIFKMAFDREWNMYVIDRGKYFDTVGNRIQASLDRIDRYDKDGNFTGWFYGWSGNTWTLESIKKEDFPVADNSILDEPSCLILDQENMIIGNWNKNRIDIYDKTTGKLTKWLGKNQEWRYGWHDDPRSAISAPYFGTEVGTFNGIIDCNLYGEKLDIVSYNSNPVMAQYSYSGGAYLRGLSHNDWHKPQELIEDKYGNLIFSDNYEWSIKFFDQSFKLITRMQLGPWGDYFWVGDFAINSQGILYFIEQRKQKLYRLQLEYNK